MNKDSVVYYSIIQYVPNQIRNERINIGVIVVNKDGSFSKTKFTNRFSRAKNFSGRNVSFLKDFSKNFQFETNDQKLLAYENTKWDLGRLKKVSGQWWDSIQFSEIKTSINPPEKVLSDMFNLFVEGFSKESAKLYRYKEAAIQLASDAFKKAILNKHPNIRGINKYIRIRSKIKGRRADHAFDVVVRNGNPYIGVKGLSFEIKKPGHIEQSIFALAYEMGDVLKSHPKLKIGVVSLLPKRTTKKIRELYQEGQNVFKDIDAELIPEKEILDWANFNIGRLPKDWIK